MMAWLSLHLVATALLVGWPLVTAGCSLAYTKLDHLPKVHAVLRFLASLGLDLPTAEKALHDFLEKEAGQ